MAEAPVVALDGLHEADVPLLDQVEEAEAAAGIAAGDRDDKTQVRLDQAPAGALIATLEGLREGDLLGGGQKRNLGDLAQVEADRVLGGTRRGLDLQVGLLLVGVEPRRIRGGFGHLCGT